mgnify:CR=1 FL=1
MNINNCSTILDILRSSEVDLTDMIKSQFPILNTLVDLILQLHTRGGKHQPNIVGNTLIFCPVVVFNHSNACSNENAQAPQTCMFNGKDFYFQQHFYHLYFCFNQEITLWIQVHRCILPSKDNICSDLSTIIYWYNEFHKNILQGTTVFGCKCISIKC